MESNQAAGTLAATDGTGRSARQLGGPSGPRPPRAPEPVGAMASSSRSASSEVMAWRWMGVGSVNPPATRLLLQGGEHGGVAAVGRQAGGQVALPIPRKGRRLLGIEC